MDKKLILREIFLTEEKLLAISNELNKAARFDSMVYWIKHVLESDIELAKLFLLPTEEKIKNAILTLVTTNSSLNHPIVNLISSRFASLTSTTPDLKGHPMKSKTAYDMLENFNPLLRLIKKHNTYFEHAKSIELIYKALRDNRLHIYKSNFNEQDLRVVLKTLQLDTSRANRDAVKYLLNFLFDQLKQNVAISGFITQPRHAWWALLDLILEAELDWLNQNSTDINNILSNLLDKGEYIPPAINPNNFIPEFNSIYNEKIWVTIDMIRIYKANVQSFIPTPTIKKLENGIESNLRSLINEEDDESIRSIQCKLLVLYEALSHYNYIDAIEMCKASEIDLRNRFIGKYIYDDDVLLKFREVKSAISSFIDNRETWRKHPLTSLLVSSSPGQGKSELVKQISNEIEKIAVKNGKSFIYYFYSIRKNISSEADLLNILKEIQNNNVEEKNIQVIIFDEIDKAIQFDFFAPFLTHLESLIENRNPLTFWFFCQSKFPTYRALNVYSEFLENKSLRDFLTRMQLGHIDIPEFKSSPQQKVFTALGYAIEKKPDLESISRKCVYYFAENNSLDNNRDLISNFTTHTEYVNDRMLSLKNDVSLPTQNFSQEDEWINIKK